MDFREGLAIVSTSRVAVERVVRCPFSVAHDYAEDFFAAARAASSSTSRCGTCADARRPPAPAGAARRRARPRRATSPAGCTTRWRSTGARGRASFPTSTARCGCGSRRSRPPGCRSRAPTSRPSGALGGVFDLAAGRRIARATMSDLLERLGDAMEAREVEFRAGVGRRRVVGDHRVGLAKPRRRGTDRGAARSAQGGARRGRRRGDPDRRLPFCDAARGRDAGRQARGELRLHRRRAARARRVHEPGCGAARGSCCISASRSGGRSVTSIWCGRSRSCSRGRGSPARRSGSWSTSSWRSSCITAGLYHRVAPGLFFTQLVAHVVFYGIPVAVIASRMLRTIVAHPSTSSG